MPLRHIYDISPPVTTGFPVYPGDAPFAPRWLARIGPDSPGNLSAVSLSPHTGAHADAPLHYDAQGAAIGAQPLDLYLGRCRVVPVFDTALIEPRHIEAALVTAPARLLLRSYRARPAGWDETYAALAPATIELLHTHAVRLIGIDTPSIDPAHRRGLDAHQAARRRGIAILEGLDLTEVPPGDYELIALPLRWTQLEASPVRAILREL
jgi:arylformamidase